MRHRTRRLAAAAGLGAGAMVVLAGCGATGGTGAAGPPGSASASPVSPALSPVAVSVTTVNVTEKEFSIVLSRKTFTAGRYTFAVTNRGTAPHNLTINGPGVTGKATATLTSGHSGSVTVILKRGTYELWCSVDHHKQDGMDLKIKVT
jgi:hypothetical protein